MWLVEEVVLSLVVFLLVDAVLIGVVILEGDVIY